MGTNEWEFQGHLVGVLNEFLHDRDLRLTSATAETPAGRKRTDVTVWLDRVSDQAALVLELKTPKTPLRDFTSDAVSKAQARNAPYVAVWNMRECALYRTPPAPASDVLAADHVVDLPLISSISRVEDWLATAAQDEVQATAYELLRVLSDLLSTGATGGVVVDATVFATALSERARVLRSHFLKDIRSTRTTSRSVYKALRQWAKKQGLDEFVDDVEVALAAQLGYRLIGQVLFYHSLRRHEPSLPHLTLDPSDDVTVALRHFWDRVRAFDYEALYEKSPLEDITLSGDSKAEVQRLVEDMAGYDWKSVQLDVLGSIFELMIPPAERRGLGQYYTPPQLADLIIALTTQRESDHILDPGVGTGTFLYRALDRLAKSSTLQPEDMLDRLWGLDISAFPAELAVINLYRLNIGLVSNFPRVSVRDFFTTSPGDELEFPPAKRNPGSTNRVRVKLREYDAIVGNPPYVRSQQLDDLDASYKSKLAGMAARAGVTDTTKFDAYAYFIMHASGFLADGARLGFVVPGAWLNNEYGARLQKFILDHYQPQMILMSEAEVFFPEQDVNTIVLVLEKLSSQAKRQSRKAIRFVTLSSPLGDILPSPQAASYWGEVDALAIDLESTPDGLHGSYRVATVDGERERQTLIEEPGTPRDWTRHLRATPAYREVFGV